MEARLVVTVEVAVTGHIAAQFTVTGFGGKCHHLTAYGRELSARCDDRLVSLRLSDGRSGYVFSTANHALIAFTAPAGGAALDRDTFVANGEAETRAANGSCTAVDPLVANASIACDGDTAHRHFRTEFSGNGGSGVRIAP